jgi:Predicted membrane protein
VNTAMSYKQKANITLTLVFIMFLLSAICKHLWPQLFLVSIAYFVCEAALIGGIADWFAVTALFKKPLNWPYHTALIPRNREKVIDSVSNMVQHDLLNPNIFRHKIEQINLSKNLFEFIEESGQLQYLIKTITRSIVDWLNSFEPETAANFLTPLINKNLLKLNLAPLTKDFILHNLTNGQVDFWLETAILRLEKLAGQEKTKILIYNFLQEQKNEKISHGLINNFIVTLLETTGGLNLQEAADSIHFQLVSTIECLKDSEHPLRHTVREILRQTAYELEHNFLVQDALGNWKADIIAKIPINNLLEDAIRAFQEGTEDYEKSIIKTILEEILEAIWVFYRNNNLLLAKINSYLHSTLFNLLKHNQTIIGDIARDALAKLTNEDLIKFIEDKAGNDLQWIRINGSIIGGLVGVVLFMFLRFIYEPYVVPLFSGWFV